MTLPPHIAERVEQARRRKADREATRAALDQADQPLTTRAIEHALADSDHTRDAVRRAVKLGVRTEAIVTSEGPRRAVLHARPDTSAPVRGSVPSVRQHSDVSAPVRSIDGAHTRAHSEPPSAPTGARLWRDQFDRDTQGALAKEQA